MFVVVFVFTWTVNTYLSLNSTSVVAHFTGFKLFDLSRVRSSISVFFENIDDQCRGPSIQEKGHLAG